MTVTDTERLAQAAKAARPAIGPRGKAAPRGRKIPGTVWGTLPAGFIAIAAMLFAIVNFFAAFAAPAALFWIQISIGAVVAVNGFVLVVLAMIVDEIRSLRQDRWLGP